MKRICFWGKGLGLLIFISILAFTGCKKMSNSQEELPDLLLMGELKYEDGVERIIIYDLFNLNTKIEQVSTNSFSIDISYFKNRYLGILFVNKDDQLLGTLGFETTNGLLMFLPTINLTAKEINLGLIEFTNRQDGIMLATSAIDPIGEGGVLNISESTMELLNIYLGIAEGFVLHGDVDDNGILDQLENKEFLFTFRYSFYNGSLKDAWDNGVFQPDHSGFNINGFNIISAYNTLNNAISNHYPVQFPSSWEASWEHSNLTGVGNEYITQNSYGNNGGTHPPTDGYYLVTFTDIAPNITGKFLVKNQRQLINNTRVPFLSFEIESGVLKKISWVWKLCSDINGTPVEVDPLVSKITIQIEKLTDDKKLERIYEFSSTQVTKSEHILSVPYSECFKVTFFTNDGIIEGKGFMYVNEQAFNN